MTCNDRPPPRPASLGDLGVPLILDARLREVDLGGWEGLSPRTPNAAFQTSGPNGRPVGTCGRGDGETEREAGARVAGAIQAALSDQSGAGPKALVVVGHGLSLRAGLDRLRADGVIDFAGPAPHLGNGDLFVAVPGRSP